MCIPIGCAETELSIQILSKVDFCTLWKSRRVSRAFKEIGSAVISDRFSKGEFQLAETQNITSIKAWDFSHSIDNSALFYMGMHHEASLVVKTVQYEKELVTYLSVMLSVFRKHSAPLQGNENTKKQLDRYISNWVAQQITQLNSSDYISINYQEKTALEVFTSAAQSSFVMTVKSLTKLDLVKTELERHFPDQIGKAQDGDFAFQMIQRYNQIDLDFLSRPGIIDHENLANRTVLDRLILSAMKVQNYSLLNYMLVTLDLPINHENYLLAFQQINVTAANKNETSVRHDTILASSLQKRFKSFGDISFNDRPLFARKLSHLNFDASLTVMREAIKSGRLNKRTRPDDLN